MSDNKQYNNNRAKNGYAKNNNYRNQNGNHETNNNRDQSGGKSGKSSSPWNVLTVRERGEQKFWTKIGVAFQGDNGSFRVMLDALPLNDTLFIMPPKEG